MKKFLLSVAVLALVCGTADAQSFLERLGQHAKSTAESTAESNISNKVSEGVNNLLNGKWGKKKDKKEKKTEQEETVAPEVVEEQVQEAPAAVAGWTCEECGKEGNTGNFCDECGAKKPGAEPAKPKKQTTTSYAKCDFVPGDEIIFEDTFENEKMGEFPSQWDLMDGYAEVGEVDGRKGICFTDDGYGEVKPLMKDLTHFLPDVFTIEYDLYTDVSSGDIGEHTLDFCLGNPDIECWNGFTGWGTYWYRSGDLGSTLNWEFEKPNGGDNVRGEKALHMDTADSPQKEGWNHFAWSFNKRALKGYVNGVRVINIPNAKVPTHFWFHHQGNYKYSIITNVRIAKGAVPLYDRLMNDGKIITYAITFETGKADLKPESMVEINRIAKLMQENPALEFEVQGHCDATGSDKVNDPLSQKRAEAIVAALVDQGIAAARLTPVGKGSHAPIASNSTDEGRAKNRRVEFVKK